MTSDNKLQRLLLFVLAAAALSFGMTHAKAASVPDPAATHAAPHELQVDVTGILNYDERDATSNVVLDFYIGAGASVTSLKWNVNVTSYEGSYLSEMKVTFTDSLGHGVTFTPGDGDDFDGTADYAGYQDLGELEQIFAVGADGILRLEFHDGFKDLAFDEPEGRWNAGTLTFGIAPVPEPSAFAMVLAGLLLFSGARKRYRP